MTATDEPIAAGREADVFALGPGDPPSRLDEVVAFRAGQGTMSANEVAALPVAAARVRGVK